MRFNNNEFAANGLERLRDTLLLDLIKDIVNMTLDNNDKTASLPSLVKLIENTELKTALKQKFAPQKTR